MSKDTSRRTIAIDGRRIGEGQPCYVIAEIGANHNQDSGIAKKTIDAAIEAGADAVKFQSFKVENWVSRDFQNFPTMQGEKNIHDALRHAELSYAMYSELADYCQDHGIHCFSTPSHVLDVDELHDRGAPAFKFGSVQVTDLPTIAHAARYGKPILLSGGASDMSEVLRAVEVTRDAGNDDLVLFHCTSAYPCSDYRMVNLNVIQSYRAIFDFPIGYSDHTTHPTLVPVAAVAMGATVIEKHITLDRTMKGPDHPFALEPKELVDMVRAIRDTEDALGTHYRRILPEEREIARLGRRSLVSARGIKAGEIIKKDALTIKRPGTGIPPGDIDTVLGRRARVDIEEDRVLTWEMI